MLGALPPTWSERIRGRGVYVPSGRIVEHFIAAIEQPLTQRGWNPAEGLENYARLLIEWGMVFAQTRCILGVERLHASMIDQIFANNLPDAAAFAELDAAAL